MLITRLLLVLLIVCSFPFSLEAQSDLSKQEKAIIRRLKHQYKLESVERFAQNGFVYYYLITKESKNMIADSAGKVIIPQGGLASEAYLCPIIFNQAHIQGMGPFREEGLDARFVMAYYTGNQRTFLTTKKIEDGINEVTFFSTRGEIISSFTGNIRENNTSPVYVTQDLSGNYGLMTMGGEILLPNVYTAINSRADGICTFSQIVNNVERMGGICFSDLTDVSVPCVFNSVEFSPSTGQWMVQLHEFDPFIEYDSNIDYPSVFLDEGQKLFEQRQYDEVRKYYTLVANEAKWANFFIGASYYMPISSIYNGIVEMLKELNVSNNKEDRHLATDIHNDLSLFYTESEKARASLRAYLRMNHKQYQASAKEMLYELSEMETHLQRMDRRVDMDLADFNLRCEEAEMRRQDEYNRQLEREKIELEQQAIREQRFAREQKERDMRMKAKMERRKREADQKVIRQKNNRQQDKPLQQQSKQQSRPQTQTKSTKKRTESSSTSLSQKKREVTTSKTQRQKQEVDKQCQLQEEQKTR